MKTRSFCLSALGIVVLGSTPALGFERIEPPELAVGQRASLAGSLAAMSYGPADVSRGGFSLPSPFAAPKERGELSAPIFPTYNPDSGISPWGMGFAATLALTRSRIIGNLAYDFDRGDELTGPFGRLVRGVDGDFYPIGLEKLVRVVPSGDEFIAYLPDGARWTFGGAARVIASSGTYAWNLREVRDRVGHLTTLSWAANESGNLFLSEADYGGRSFSQYRIELGYEPVMAVDSVGAQRPKFVDYRAGSPLILDRRVKTVVIRTRNAQTGTFDERCRYVLGYTDETTGAAFYLSRIDTIFASGEAAPPITYGYNLKGTDYASLELREVPELTSVLHTFGFTSDVIQPWRSAIIDADNDGNPDLEVGDNTRTLLSQRGSGRPDDPLRFELSTLLMPSAANCQLADQIGCLFAPCRPTNDDELPLAPRLLSQLDPDGATVHVAHFQYDSDADQTAISICSREGVRLSKQTVDARWETSSVVRFVDLNNDHLPDLVRVGFGRYDVLPSIRRLDTNDATPAWGSSVSGALLDAKEEPFTPSDAWVSDVSGDGIPDIVATYGNAIEVWHGLGNFRFTTSAEELKFFAADGTPIGDFEHYKLVPADLNKDGLEDYFVTNADGDTTYSRFISYFTNSGGRFVQTPVRALDQMSPTASAPVVTTLDGSGDLSITVTDEGKAYAVSLENAGTGLMATANDGKGTILSFEYARAAAVPGVRHRTPLLSRLTVDSSGYDEVSYEYRYRDPAVHSRGRFLIGFGEVSRQEPLGGHSMTFLNGDDWAGLLLLGRETDARLPDLVKIEERAYDDQRFQGIPYKRLAASASGWMSVDGASRSVDVTTYDAYTNDFCASHTTLVTAHRGVLSAETTRAEPAGLARHLHCLEGRVVEVGAHADATFDFRREQVITHNEAGSVTGIATLGAEGPLVQQEVEYDVDLDPTAISVPGRGTNRIAYDPSTKLPLSVTAPDGVVTRVVARHPRTDAITDVLTDRGAMSWHAFATYEGQERLATHWSDLDGSNESQPHERYQYQYASTNHPATIALRTLVDAAAGSYRDTTEFLTANNEKIALAQLHDRGWVIDGFVARSRANRTASRFMVMTQPPDRTLGTLDYDGILQRAGELPARVEITIGSTFGIDVGTEARLHEDVTKTTATRLAIDAEKRLARTTLVNGANATTTLLDPAGKLTLGFVDEGQATYGFAYDALGRLRAVTLPDGARHRVSYDEYGRVSATVREGLALVTNTYASAGGGTTDQLAGQIISSAPAASAAPIPQRSIEWLYDGAGRKIAETHRDLASSATRTFAFYYDGATPSAPLARGSLGLLTGVSGDGYTKTTTYRADGKPLRTELVLDGFRTIEHELAYREDGTLRDQNVTVKDTSGEVLARSNHHQDVDSVGRPSRASVNGTGFDSIGYDALGRPELATLTGDRSLLFAYDPLTRLPLGFDLQARQSLSFAWSTRVKHDDRGFIGQELLAMGPSQVQRSYAYSSQGYLTNAVASGDDPSSYSFDTIGLPTSASLGGKSYGIVRNGDTLTAGEETYRFDALGRVVTIGNLSIGYGPDGQADRATRGDETVSYVYDQGGQRLLKKTNGVPAAAYVGDAYLTPAAFFEPVRVNGRLVGVLRNGDFTPVASDMRGTVESDTDGTLRVATPFGARATHPDMAEIVDYAAKGFDPSLGATRMGVRDYDPRIAQFLTPDPLYLEHPERCVAHPHQCNLYGYAENRPLDLTDPGGTEANDGTKPRYSLNVYELQQRFLFTVVIQGPDYVGETTIADAARNYARANHGIVVRYDDPMRSFFVRNADTLAIQAHGDEDSVFWYSGLHWKFSLISGFLAVPYDYLRGTALGQGIGDQGFRGRTIHIGSCSSASRRLDGGSLLQDVANGYYFDVRVRGFGADVPLSEEAYDGLKLMAPFLPKDRPGVTYTSPEGVDYCQPPCHMRTVAPFDK